MFSPVITKDNVLNRIQAAIANAFNSITGPFVGGNLLSNISIGTGSTNVPHGLGRTPEIWVICDQNTNTNVWRIQWDSTFISLQAANSCTISLWVN